MKNFRIISRLEVKSEYVVKGLRMDGLRKIDFPKNLVKNFEENFIDEIFYDDIVASLYNRPINYKILKSVSNLINIPLSVSGRVKTISDYYKLFDSGADKVSANTSIFENSILLNKASKIFGSQSVCSHIQYKNLDNEKKDPEVFAESGRERKYKKLYEWIKFVQDNGAGEIYLFSIDNDGIDYEIDIEILEKARKITNVPLIYGGGINSLVKIKKLIDIGFDGITLSSALYDNSLDLNKIKKNLSNMYSKINFNLNNETK